MDVLRGEKVKTRTFRGPTSHKLNENHYGRAQGWKGQNKNNQRSHITQTEWEPLWTCSGVKRSKQEQSEVPHHTNWRRTTMDVLRGEKVKTRTIRDPTSHILNENHYGRAQVWKGQNKNNQRSHITQTEGEPLWTCSGVKRSKQHGRAQGWKGQNKNNQRSHITQTEWEPLWTCSGVKRSKQEHSEVPHHTNWMRTTMDVLRGEKVKTRTIRGPTSHKLNENHYGRAQGWKGQNKNNQRSHIAQTEWEPLWTCSGVKRSKQEQSEVPHHTNWMRTTMDVLRGEKVKTRTIRGPTSHKLNENHYGRAQGWKGQNKNNQRSHITQTEWEPLWTCSGVKRSKQEHSEVPHLTNWMRTTMDVLRGEKVKTTWTCSGVKRSKQEHSEVPHHTNWRRTTMDVLRGEKVKTKTFRGPTSHKLKENHYGRAQGWKSQNKNNQRSHITHTTRLV